MTIERIMIDLILNTNLETFFYYYCFYAGCQSVLFCSFMINDIGIMGDLRYYQRYLVIVPSLIIVALLAPIYSGHAILVIYKYIFRKPNAKINT